MGLVKSHGNMYDWVTHMHSHLAGWQGEPRLIESELTVDYGIRKTIFIEYMGDLFADGVKDSWKLLILKHTKSYPLNMYVFQTKNPASAKGFFAEFPPQFMIGTTIESNRPYKHTKAPSPEE